MTPDRHFEHELPGVLDDLFVGPMPAYRNQILEQVARTRQRPAWSFPERWLPMVDVARQPVVVTSRVPWRPFGLAFVLLALLLAMVAALLVTGRSTLPAPFGRAANGVVAYASAGDIYTVDPVTGTSTLVGGGPETDLNPRWSRDGTQLAFERRVDGPRDRGAVYAGDLTWGLVYVARADGTGVTLVTPDPLANIARYEFSPAGTELLLSADVNGVPSMLIAATDGSRIRRLDVRGPATDAAWRPPDGAEILFMGRSDPSTGDGNIAAVNARDGSVRTIREATPKRSRGAATWSPTGSSISYVEWAASPGLTAQVHIMAADGSGDRVLPSPPNAVWQALPTWSNDGKRLLVIRGYGATYDGARLAILPADGSGPGIEIEYPGTVNGDCCSVWEWAPDDSAILGTPTDALGAPMQQVLLDPAAGTFRRVTWPSTSVPSWQRRTP